MGSELVVAESVLDPSGSGSSDVLVDRKRLLRWAVVPERDETLEQRDETIEIRARAYGSFCTPIACRPHPGPQ